MTDTPTGAAERVSAFVDRWTDATAVERIEWVRSGDAQIALTIADLRAVLEERKQLRAHILDIYAHATPYGDIPGEPGWIGTYLLTAGAMHRALGKIGHTAPSCQAEAEAQQLRARLDQIGEVREEWGYRWRDAYAEVGFSTEAIARAMGRPGDTIMRRFVSDWSPAYGTDAPGADATQDDATQWTADANQPEIRDTAVWCWNRHPDHPLHCGRLARHDGRHKRGEREWDDATQDGAGQQDGEAGADA